MMGIRNRRKRLQTDAFFFTPMRNENKEDYYGLENNGFGRD